MIPQILREPNSIIVLKRYSARILSINSFKKILKILTSVAIFLFTKRSGAG